MTPTEAIQELGELMKQMNARLHRMHIEADEISEQWDALGRMAGQRDDHAAELLAKLRPHLSGLATFATNCETQLDRFVADPFGRKTQPGCLI